MPGRQNEQDMAGLQQAHPGAGGGAKTFPQIIVATLAPG